MSFDAGFALRRRGSHTPSERDLQVRLCGGLGIPEVVGLGIQSVPEPISAVFPNPCEIEVGFGSVVVGQRAIAVIQIGNLGGEPLDISYGVPSLAAAFDMDDSPQQPIQPGEFYSFTVSFEPLDTGAVSSTLTIQTDGSNFECPLGSSNAVLTVELSGTGT